MIKKIIFAIVLVLFFKPACANQDGPNPMIIADLAKIKAQSENAHAKRNRNTLPKEIIDEHNALAIEVNGFIDSVILSVKAHKDNKQDIEQGRVTINHKINIFVEKMNKLDKEPSDAHNSMKNKLSIESKFSNGPEIQANAALGTIGLIFGWLDELWNWKSKSSAKEQEDFIQKLESQKWLKIED